ncbi:MAG TPA: AEC family transporter [Novosphingobium sp.]|nr:AEC family transporter [Novosphingobium sp.]
MLSVLLIVLPVFALILAGWLARRLGALGPLASGEINRFVVWLALPALLFDIVANARVADLWQPGFVAAFGLGMMAVFAVTIALRWRGKAGRHLADASIDGLNAAYANTGYIGFPLLAATLGQGAAAHAAMEMTLIASILTICCLFALGIILVEVGLQAEGHPAHVVRKVALSVARNPLVVAPVLGALVMVSGQRLPAPAETFLKLLGGAASPCALVGLGLFLGEKRVAAPGAGAAATLLVALKLLVQPAATWALAVWVFHLPPLATHAAVLIAALPTGTGPFMVAEFYEREAGLTSRVVLLSTILSLATITLYLARAL